MGILDDTLIYFIIGDNGASAEGSLQGTLNEMTVAEATGRRDARVSCCEHIDKFGGPEAYNHYAVGWAHAHVHALPVDQAGRLALGRHAQRRRSCTGPTASRRAARCATSSATSST